MVGFVTLNYSPQFDFLGTAIPIDEIKPVIERLKKGSTETAETLPARRRLDRRPWVKVTDGQARGRQPSTKTAPGISPASARAM